MAKVRANIIIMNNRQQRFTAAIKEHKRTIYMVCYMFSHDEEEIKDLFQEVLINLWKGFDSFGGRSNLNSWVYRVSLNTCISYQRKENRRRGQSLDFDIDMSTADDSDTEQIGMLHSRISRLRPFDRAIVLLWLEGISYDEIAGIVGITPKIVGVRLFRIKEELKKM